MDASRSESHHTVNLSSHPDTELSRENFLAAAARRLRRSIMDLDRSASCTRLSDRRQMICLHPSASKEPLNDPVRFYGGTRRHSDKRRAVDWG